MSSSGTNDRLVSIVGIIVILFESDISDEGSKDESSFIVSDADKKLIEEYLHKTGGKTLSIPYRENRAVIFKSELFHQSDVVNFKSGYENHRINITMVFGYGDLI